MVATFNLYSLRSLLRPYWMAFMLTTLVTGLVVILVTKPQTSTESIAIPRYSSTASLLLSSSRQFRSKGLFAARERGDLEVWLLDENLFAQMLERERFHEKLEQSLAQKNPTLSRYARGVQVRLLFQYFYGGPAAEIDAETQEAAAYAEVGEEEGTPKRVIRRPTRILIQAIGPDPKRSQELVQASIKLMQRLLEEVATRRVKGQRKVVEGYLSAARRKVAKAEISLSRLKAAEPDEVRWLERRQSQLRTRRLTLKNELESLRRQLDSERAILSSSSNDKVASEATQRLSILEAKRLESERVLLPDSPQYRELLEQIRSTKQLVATLKAERVQRTLTSLESEASAKRALFQQTLNELEELEKRLPSLRTQRKFQDRAHELDAWQEEILTWEHKLLEIRIEECLCKNEGLSVLLLSPSPGVKLSLSDSPGFSSYQRVFRILPLAPLLGLLSILLLHFYRSLGRIGSKMEYYLDVPLLAEIQSPGSLPLKDWQQALKGRSNQESNLPT